MRLPLICVNALLGTMLEEDFQNAGRKMATISVCKQYY